MQGKGTASPTDQGSSVKERYSHRVSVRGSVNFAVGNCKGKGRILNLTIPGCMVETHYSLKKGDCMSLSLFIPEFLATLDVSKGIVRWVEGRRFGVDSVRVEQKQRLRYNACVARCLRSSTTTCKSDDRGPETVNLSPEDLEKTECHKSKRVLPQNHGRLS